MNHVQKIYKNPNPAGEAEAVLSRWWHESIRCSIRDGQVRLSQLMVNIQSFLSYLKTSQVVQDLGKRQQHMTKKNKTIGAQKKTWPFHSKKYLTSWFTLLWVFPPSFSIGIAPSISGNFEVRLRGKGTSNVVDLPWLTWFKFSWLIYIPKFELPCFEFCMALFIYST